MYYLWITRGKSSWMAANYHTSESAIEDALAYRSAGYIVDVRNAATGELVDR